MNLERTQHIGHYGVTFTVIRFTVLPADRHTLVSLCLLEAGASAYKVRLRLVDLYEKMLARDLPCKMALAISNPLNRQQADLLNERGTIIAGLIASALSAPVGLVSPFVGSAVAGAVGFIAKGVIRSYHAGDVIIGLDAQVHGGIGPQRSVSAMVKQFQGG